MQVLKYALSLSVAMFLFSGCGVDELSQKSDDSTTQQEENDSTVVEKNYVIKPATQVLTETQKEILKVHNERRKNEFEDVDLNYNLSLEKAAKKYAESLAESGKRIHDPQNASKGYGENLFAHANDPELTITDAMLHWYNEEKPAYAYETGECNSSLRTGSGNKIVCGHYTQVVWQETLEVGCATAKYKNGLYKEGAVYICKYRLPGNVTDQKPYCTEYSIKDIYTSGVPTINSTDLTTKALEIEMAVEDRVNCTRKNNRNGSIKFAKGFASAQLIDFDVFNGDKYTGTFTFDTVSIQNNTVSLKGTGLEKEKYPISMDIKFVGETAEYYGVELEWNGVNIAETKFSRKIKAKFYK